MERMVENILGFTQVEYLIVFNTIIFGIVASEYFTGWGDMLRYRKEIKVYPLHFLWTIFSFLTLIQIWYGIWPRTVYINKSIIYFFYALVPMFIFHLISVALFPRLTLKENRNLVKYYFQNSRLLFILYAVYFATTILSSYIYDDKGDVLTQNVIRFAGVLFSLLGAYFNRKVWLHYLFLIIGFFALSLFILAIPS